MLQRGCAQPRRMRGKAHKGANRIQDLFADCRHPACADHELALAKWSLGSLAFAGRLEIWTKHWGPRILLNFYYYCVSCRHAARIRCNCSDMVLAQQAERANCTSMVPRACSDPCVSIYAVLPAGAFAEFDMLQSAGMCRVSGSFHTEVGCRRHEFISFRWGKARVLADSVSGASFDSLQVGAWTTFQVTLPRSRPLWAWILDDPWAYHLRYEHLALRIERPGVLPAVAKPSAAEDSHAASKSKVASPQLLPVTCGINWCFHASVNLR